MQAGFGFVARGEAGVVCLDSKPPYVWLSATVVVYLQQVRNSMVDAQIVASGLEALGMIVAAVTTSVTLYFVGNKFVKQETLKNDLDLAMEDIEFLLTVERIHCVQCQESTGKSNKNTIRNKALSEGKKWSGRFTPGRVDKQRTKPKTFI